MVLSSKLASRSLSVFLTGATGFLGGAFLSTLLDSSFDGQIVCLARAEDQDGAEERVRRSIARFGRHLPQRLPANLKVLCGDVTSHAWHNAPELDGITHVLHLAANTSFGHEEGIHRVNVEGAMSVAEAMHRRPIERYVHVGTASICGANPPTVVHEDNYPNPNVTHLVPYTSSKSEAEMLLKERYGDLPLVVARPSIVVGHTQLGCRPSGSIFWVLRAVEALRFITWNPENRVDVVPVDWAASALADLLFAPALRYHRYHVSAGEDYSIRWSELAKEYSRLYGGPSANRYEVGGLRQLTPQRVKESIGERLDNGYPRYVRHALGLYYRFCAADSVFDNRRLLSEGVPPPPRFTDYMRVCLESSKSSILDQMRIDLEPTPVLV